MKNDPRKLTHEKRPTKNDPRKFGPTKFGTHENYNPRKLGPTKIETHEIAGDPCNLAMFITYCL